MWSAVLHPVLEPLMHTTVCCAVRCNAE
jgi:hypothetical protein